MTGVESDVVELLRKANGEYKMSYREIAEWVGVGKYVVFRWVHGMSKITAKNYKRVAEMMGALKGRKIKYKGQAMAILRGEE